MVIKRIIPCLDVFQGKTVKGINFINLKEIGNPVEMGQYYSNVGA
ncbi:MAG: HisA/HisF-related TIM barrel protein, partial [Bacteroidales bacterium]